MRDDDQKLKGIKTCSVLVSSVLEFDMDHINNFKVKGIKVFLCYNSGLEKLKQSPKKVELVEAVK